MNLKGGLVLVILLVAGIAGGMYLFQMAPADEIGVVATLPIQFTAMDKLAGENDAATSAVKIYSVDLELYETVTMDAVSKESALPYTTGTKLGLYIYDASDTSVCEQYIWVTVPYASESNVYDNAFQITIWNTDREVTMPMFVESGGVEIADAGVEDLTTNGWDSAFAYIDFELRPEGADTGYVNSENFLKGYGNNHYFVLDIADNVSATTAGGWALFNVLGGASMHLDRNDHRYIVFSLSDDAITRDLQSDGSYDPTGLWTLNLALDLTGMTAGMNISITYDYVMYADWTHFVEFGSWGADMESTTDEAFYINY